MKKITIKKDEQVRVDTLEELRWLYENTNNEWIYSLERYIDYLSINKKPRRTIFARYSEYFMGLSFFKNHPRKKTIKCSELMGTSKETKPSARIYIAGKITDIEAEAGIIFELAEQLLTLQHPEATIINPMKLLHDPDRTHEAYMEECIEALAGCDTMYLLPNWKDSKGACMEVECAIYHNKKIESL